MFVEINIENLRGQNVKKKNASATAAADTECCLSQAFIISLEGAETGGFIPTSPTLLAFRLQGGL